MVACGSANTSATASSPSNDPATPPYTAAAMNAHPAEPSAADSSSITR
jgi:hypothetical protein